MTTGKATSPGIQSLRFIAASSVVMDHEIGSLTNRHILPSTFEQAGWHLGTFGVWTFFLISGFIMISAEHKAFGNPISTSKFFVKRLIRIVPMYWIATLVSILFFSWKLGFATYIYDTIFSLFFVPYLPAGQVVMQPLLGQGWTLNYEMFFYAVFAVCMFFPFRTGAFVLVSAIILFVCMGALVRPFAVAPDPTTAFTFLSNPIILLFPTGAILCILKMNYPRAFPPIDNFLAFLIMVGIFVLAIFVFSYFKYAYPMNTYDRMMFWPMAVIVVFISSLPKASQKYFDNKLVLLGDASYCTYLFHIFVARALNFVFPRFIHTKELAFIYIAVIVVIANLVGVVIHLALERPLTNWLRAWVFRGTWLGTSAKMKRVQNPT